MADLVTHGCAAILLKLAESLLRGRARPLPPGGEMVATCVAGTCLPDLLGRVPGMAFLQLRWTFPAIPEFLVYLFTPMHLPLGICLMSYAVSFLFPETQRKRAFLNLLVGGMLHLAVDLLQSHFGVGYLLLFPFSLWDFEFGVIGSEDTVKIVPFLLPFTAVAAWLRWGRHPVAAPPKSPDR